MTPPSVFRMGAGCTSNDIRWLRLRIVIISLLILSMFSQGRSQCASLSCLPGGFPGLPTQRQTVTTADGCTSWTGTLNGWTVSHGAPIVVDNGFVSGYTPLYKDSACLLSYGVHMVHEYGGNTDYPDFNGGSGIWITIPNHFLVGTTYAIRVVYYFRVPFYPENTLQEQGWLHLNAVQVGPTGDVASCREVIPTAIGSTSIEAIPLPTSGENGQGYDELIYYTPTEQSNVLWIYPEGYDYRPGQNDANPQVDIYISNVLVCPACPYGTDYFNSGTLPLSANTGAIYAGTSTVDEGSGTGTISNQTSQVSTWTVTNSIELDPGFIGTVSGSGSLTLNISGCTNSAQEARPDYNDSTNLVAGTGPPVIQTLAEAPPLEERSISMLTDSVANPTTAVPSNLTVYPTVNNGSFTISGSAADLSNATILIMDQTGQTLYKSYNESAMSIPVNLNSLSAGVYFVEIVQSGKTTTKKIIVTNR